MGAFGGGLADLKKAQELFGEGNLPLAEIYARRCLARKECVDQASLLMDELRHAYGMPQGYVLSERNPLHPHGEGRYLVIKAWGQGFWSEGHHFAGQLLLAELTQRKPIALWGRNCLFRKSSDVEASRNFFAGISAARVEGIPHTATIYPPKWSWENIHKDNVNLWLGDHSRMAAQYFFAREEVVLVSDFYSPICSIRPWIDCSSRYYGMTDDELYCMP